jgi:hypothetical protein
MAESPAHRFGQIIGATLEAAVKPLLMALAKRHKLFPDRKGPRPAGKGKKVSWIDKYGNVHDLDYVFERGGSSSRIGVPVAFIESAWRRYTKHSRNKAQEIQGAILPLKERHHQWAPFIGVVLAGDFTEPSLEQLRSQGFSILYFSYESVLAAFASVGIDAAFSERTPDAQFADKVKNWNKLSARAKKLLATALLDENRESVAIFVDELTRSLTRQISCIRVLPLHGVEVDCASVEEAIKFVEEYEEATAGLPIVNYLISANYNNGDKVEAQFADKRDALAFLRQYEGPGFIPLQ